MDFTISFLGPHLLLSYQLWKATKSFQQKCHNALQHAVVWMRKRNDLLEESPQSIKVGKDLAKIQTHFLDTLKKQNSKKKQRNKIQRKDYDTERLRELPGPEERRQAVWQAMLMLAVLVDAFKDFTQLQAQQRFVLNVLMVDWPLGPRAFPNHNSPHPTPQPPGPEALWGLCPGP